MDDKGPLLQHSAIVILIIAWVTTLLRFYVRLIHTRTPGLDDAFALAALVLLTAVCSIFVWGASQGIGKHIPQLTLSSIVNGTKAIWIASLLYVCASCLIKISFTLSLLRFLRQKSHRWAMYILIGVQLLITVVYIICTMIVCTPYYYFWTQITQPDTGKCLTVYIMIGATYGHAITAFLCDVILAVTPGLMVRKMQMSRRNKIVVGLLLALGSLAGIASLARIAYAAGLKINGDYLYKNTELMIWSCVEVGITQICTSVATLRPLAEKLHILTSEVTSIRSRADGKITTQESRLRTRDPNSSRVPHINTCIMAPQDSWQNEYGDRLNSSGGDSYPEEETKMARPDEESSKINIELVDYKECSER